jgi:hypothetical protein
MTPAGHPGKAGGNLGAIGRAPLQIEASPAPACRWRPSPVPAVARDIGSQMTKNERETLEHFAGRYRVAPSEVSRRVELAVIGGDWGANGYTTMAQADLLARKLGLRPGTRLLDLGAGRGWPGLYLAAAAGCRVVLADVPIEGLRAAADRAKRERLADRAAPVAASARGLPFTPAAFDAIVHTDVLC